MPIQFHFDTSEQVDNWQCYNTSIASFRTVSISSCFFLALRVLHAVKVGESYVQNAPCLQCVSPWGLRFPARSHRREDGPCLASRWALGLCCFSAGLLGRFHVCDFCGDVFCGDVVYIWCWGWQKIPRPLVGAWLASFSWGLTWDSEPCFAQVQDISRLFKMLSPFAMCCKV